jgi:SAM-dependent methyltransferase
MNPPPLAPRVDREAKAPQPLGDPGSNDYYREVESIYSAMAPTYDMSIGMNPVAARSKALAMRRLVALAPPSSRLLDIGCGPGQEAVTLARRGYRVFGIDSSAGMVELARERAQGLPAGAATFAQMRASDVGELALQAQHFDAAFSFYAVLNLEPRVEPVAKGVFSLLDPGAPFLVGLLNPTVLFELALYPAALRLKGFRKASQRPVRLKVSRGASDAVGCFLYSPRAFARLLAPWFTLESFESVHLFLPPPDERMLRFPTLVRGVNRMESRLESRWPFRSLGYFSLLTFRRKEGSPGTPTG